MPKLQHIDNVQLTERSWLSLDKDEHGAAYLEHWRLVRDVPTSRGRIRLSDEEAYDAPDALEALALLFEHYW